MKYQFPVVFLLLLAVCYAPAQVASHVPTSDAATARGDALPKASISPVMQVTNRPVLRVNGAVLTDRDLVREMFAIFPYARQHNGFPKGREEQIRQGALQMLEFEELVYQETQRRKMVIPAARLRRAEAEFRSQFSGEEEFNQYLQTEMNGSRQALRRAIRRSLLIEALLKAEVTAKSKVSLLEARSFYKKNPDRFRQNESFNIQTISIMPPAGAGAEDRNDARKRAEDALRQAKATKGYEEFGLLAEKVSEDDYRVNMGDHKKVDRDKLPPEIVNAALRMQPGEVSDLLELGGCYTLFRLNAHTPAGQVEFGAVKDKLLKDLQRAKTNELRMALSKKLRQGAKIEEL